MWREKTQKKILSSRWNLNHDGQLWADRTTASRRSRCANEQFFSWQFLFLKLLSTLETLYTLHSVLQFISCRLGFLSLSSLPRPLWRFCAFSALRKFCSRGVFSILSGSKRHVLIVVGRDIPPSSAFSWGNPKFMIGVRFHKPPGFILIHWNF